MPRFLVIAATLSLTACSQADETITAEPADEPVTQAAVSQAPAADPYASERPIAWDALLARPREAADQCIPYGPGAQEFGELWLPEGDGPFPVVVMIHGGCWLSQIPGTILQDYLAAEMRARGIAVWNLEYARLGHDDGGFPGTFEDIAEGVAYLRTVAQDYPLDLDRIVFSGHSAGGHLALWAAGSTGIGGSIYFRNQVDPRAVITLAGINDLEDYRDTGPGRCGEPATVNQLVDADTRDNPFADTSPARLLPLGVRQIVISGELDPIVPPELGERYTQRARNAGDDATHIVLDNAGHFELIDPTSPAWRDIIEVIETELRD